MVFTKEQLMQCAGWFEELSAKSIGSFPSEFGVATGNNELNRVFRMDVSDALDFGIAFLQKYHTANAIPSSYEPSDLVDDKWTVTNPVMDGEMHEGEYRHVRLRVFRQVEDGREYFFIVQTLAKGFEADVTRTYEYQAAAGGISTSPVMDGVKFYDSDTEYNNERVLYSDDGIYALWSHATLGTVISHIADVGQDPDGYFKSVSDTAYSAGGIWLGSFVMSAISETVADLSKFRLAASDHYHANHDQPILKLENVAPSAAHDICEYLNQDTFTDIEYFDGTLDGTYYRIKVRTEQQTDGSYNVFLLLADSGNEELYYYFQASPTVIRGYYYKWEATEATINTMLSTLRFEPDGTIDTDPDSGTSSTLQEIVLGRTVQVVRGNRDDSDRLFDWEIAITWDKDQSYDGGDDGNGGRLPLVTYGELQEQITLQEDVVSATLPTLPDLGEISDGGRIKTVTRYDNFDVKEGKYKYRKNIIKYVAPLNDTSLSGGSVDDWFLLSERAGWEREVNRVQTLVVDDQGAPGWEPGDGIPYVHTITIPRRRTIHEISQAKMFVRFPTTDDIAEANITAAERSVIADAGYSEQTDRVQQSGNNLYLYVRTTVTYGDWAQDREGDIEYNMATYNGVPIYNREEQE